MKKGLFKTVMVGLCLFCSTGTLGLFVYTQWLHRRVLPQDRQERERLLEEGAKTSYPASYKMEKLIVNLRSRTTRLRFLDIQIHLIPYRRSGVDTLNDFRDPIHDIVIDAIGEMRPAQLNSVHGKVLLENRIKGGINNYLKSKVVREIQFSKFTIQ